MKRTFKFNDKTEIELSNAVGWTMEYREQFGHDIVPDLLPVLSAVLSIVKEIGVETDVKEVMRKVDGEVIQNALINLAGLQFVDFINLIWAMAKDADETIPTPKKWVKQFDDGFFLDKLAPEIFNFIMEGFVSTKNLSSLLQAGEK